MLTSVLAGRDELPTMECKWMFMLSSNGALRCGARGIERGNPCDKPDSMPVPMMQVRKMAVTVS